MPEKTGAARRLARLSEARHEVVRVQTSDGRSAQNELRLDRSDPAGTGVRGRGASRPRAAGARGSGLISFDNNDATAANGLKCLLVAGLPRLLPVNWNIVPWYLQTVQKPTDVELEEAVPALEQFLRPLQRLEVEVLLGRTAQEGWSLTGLDRPGLTVLPGPHPSPRNFNTRPKNRPALVEVFRRAAELIGE